MFKYAKLLGVSAALLGSACASGSTPEPAPVEPRYAPTTMADRPARGAQPSAFPVVTAEAAPSAIRGATLAQAVAAYLRRDGAAAADAAHVIERLDLNADGTDDALVLLRSRRYCGSLGCMLLVFERIDKGYQLTSAFRLGRTPLVATETRTDGWRDLVAPMTLASSGMRLVVIKHDRTGYSSDVTRMPVVPPTREVSGKVLFADD